MKESLFQVRLLVTGILVLFICAASSFGQSPAPAAPEAPQQIQVKVMLVASDLSLKPVPKRSLTICRVPDCASAFSVETDFQGQTSALLPPGQYKIANPEPVEFEGKSYLWDFGFTVVSGQGGTIELSNDNAKVSAAKTQGSGKQGAGRVFRSAKNSVVTVEAESGQGSGFIVDPQGLVVTNAHVVSDSRVLVVAFDGEHRRPAKLVAVSPTDDVAVLWYNPSGAASFPPLPLAVDSASASPVEVGDAVYAIGSPLGMQKVFTTGMVSGVEPDHLVSDININPGNSGGPLLDEKGQVVGITTYSSQASSGPGISGVIRIWKAVSFIDQARAALRTQSPPEDTWWPPRQKVKYPAELIKEYVRSREKLDLDDYHFETSHFDVRVLTPPLMAYFQHEDEIQAARIRSHKSQRHGKKENIDPLSDLRIWNEYPAEVYVVVMPRVKTTGGSIFLSMLTQGASRLKMKYKGAFDSAILRRGSAHVAPIMISREMTSEDFSTESVKMSDAAYAGQITFYPDAFKPAGKDEDVFLEVLNADNPDKNDRIRLKPKFLAMIWRDFEPLVARGYAIGMPSVPFGTASPAGSAMIAPKGPGSLAPVTASSSAQADAPAAVPQSDPQPPAPSQAVTAPVSGAAPLGDKTCQAMATSAIKGLATACQTYAVDYGHAPTPEGGCKLVPITTFKGTLSPDYIQYIPACDPWGSPYMYLCWDNGANFAIISYGKDESPDKANEEAYIRAFLETKQKPITTACYQSDIIWLNDALVAYPEGEQKDCKKSNAN